MFFVVGSSEVVAQDVSVADSLTAPGFDPAVPCREASVGRVQV